MQEETTHQPQAATSSSDAILQRVLAAVEKDRGRGRLELALAIILSLASLATTWCGYQGRMWGNLQSGKQSAADTMERQAAEDTIVGLQWRTFDGIELTQYWTALRQGDNVTRDAIFARMRPQLRKTIELSLAAGVLRDPTVLGPLQRPEYVLTEEQNAKRLKAEARQAYVVAEIAGRHAGTYISLTLSFASVLFFGGITGTFTARRVKEGLAWLALLLFLGTIAFLIGLPVCRG